MSEEIDYAKDLSNGWTMVRLGDIADIQSGVTKNSKKQSADSREVPYLRVANVQRGWLDLTEIKTIHATTEQIQQTRLQPGDVLFNEGGDRDKLGRGWVWNCEIEECIHQNHVFRARAHAGIHPKYISYYGNSWGTSYFLNSGKQTTNLASLNRQMLKDLPIRLAPLPEQHRIVAEIEKHFTRLDDAVATLKRIQASLKRARASVLKAAVEGRLVPTEAELARAEGRSYEPASVLLERILEERKRRHEETNGKKKYKVPVEPETSEIPVLPNGWTWTTMDSLLTTIEAGRSFQCNPAPPSAEDVGIVKVSAVTWGTYDEQEAKTVDDPAMVNPEYFIKPGDFLFSRANTIDLVGACVIATRGGSDPEAPLVVVDGPGEVVAARVELMAA